MCHLNLLIKNRYAINGNEDLMDTLKFLQSATSYSYGVNSDGDGFYANGVLAKSVNKLDLFQFHNEVKDGGVILTHQRLATSGLSKEFTQPFENTEFVLVHNGIINDFLGEEGSDTFGFFNKFVAKFEELKGERESRIVGSIKSLLDNLSYGSYSIAILDKVTDRMYYFKDNLTSIYFFRSLNMMFITTAEKNYNFLKFIRSEDFKSKIKIRDYRIYRITSDLYVKKVGDIEHTTKVSEYWKDFKWSKYNFEEKVENNEEDDTNYGYKEVYNWDSRYNYD